MNILKKIYCRTVQVSFRLALPLLPYREPKLYSNLKEVKDILLDLGAESVLLVTGKTHKRIGATLPLEKSLNDNGIKVVVYSDTKPNPTVGNVEEVKELYIKNSCDAIIAFGGGSPLDCAKALGALVAYPKKDLKDLKGVLKVRRKTPTIIAIPTTAGTGSECTLAAVITDDVKKDKYAISSFPLIPEYAVLDPRLTFTLPKELTATTGMDALTHAVEAYIGRSTTKETRRRALYAVKLIFENIYAAYTNGLDYGARKNMMIASYNAGIAFSKSYVGYVHAVAHSLGGEYNVAHGLANAILLPVILEEYGKSVHKKLYELAVVSGLCNEEDSYEEGANKFISAIYDLNERMNIGKKFKELKKEDITSLAIHADKEANPLYPVPKLMNAKELEKIYYRVL